MRGSVCHLLLWVMFFGFAFAFPSELGFQRKQKRKEKREMEGEERLFNLSAQKKRAQNIRRSSRVQGGVAI
jgi:hypothetical protein